MLLSRPAKSFVDNLVNGEYKFHIVGDNEELPLGGKTLRFINVPFLHWPDTILTYLEEDKILFPCDFLGSHYSSPHTFNDELDEPEKARKAPSSSTTARSCGRTSSTSSRRASA